MRNILLPLLLVCGLGFSQAPQPAPGTIDTLVSNRVDTTSSNRAVGYLSIVAGVVLVPVGAGVYWGHTLPKCDDEPSGTFSMNIGPCSSSGSSGAGEAAGIGISLMGFFLIILGMAKT